MKKPVHNFSVFLLTLVALLGMISIPNSALAKEKKVLDLGELEVDGELRRPSLQWLDSSRRAQELLPELYKNMFAEIENELTKPMTVAEYVNLKNNENKVMEISDVGP
jgi:hypothetical protein